ELVSLWAVPLGVDDEGAVHPLRDVIGEGKRVAVIEMQAEGLRVELVGDRSTRWDHPGAETWNTVHLCGMDAVEVDRVGMRGAVTELDPQSLAFAAAERGTGNPAV